MQAKDTFFSRKQTINCRGELLDLSLPKIMGIINLTPDSFYDGGKYKSEKDVIDQIHKMIHDGCDIFDFGAYSSRPGAQNVTEDEEFKRLATVLQFVRKEFPHIIISIDTFRSKIAKQVVADFEVDIINDISAGELDPKMFETIADIQVPYVIMHMKGNPSNMQTNPQYKNVVQEVMMYFSEKIEKLKLLGVNDVVIDPGFGFGKNIEHNYQLLKYLNDLRIFELPILVGMSRKSMLYKLLDSDATQSLNATTVANTLALAGGANILRVHDVKEAAETLKVFYAFNNADIDNWND